VRSHPRLPPISHPSFNRAALLRPIRTRICHFSLSCMTHEAFKIPSFALAAANEEIVRWRREVYDSFERAGGTAALTLWGCCPLVFPSCAGHALNSAAAQPCGEREARAVCAPLGVPSSLDHQRAGGGWPTPAAALRVRALIRCPAWSDSILMAGRPSAAVRWLNLCPVARASFAKQPAQKEDQRRRLRRQQRRGRERGEKVLHLPALHLNTSRATRPPVSPGTAVSASLQAVQQAAAG
jgi:hypothetical protein